MKPNPEGLTEEEIRRKIQVLELGVMRAQIRGGPCMNRQKRLKVLRSYLPSKRDDLLEKRRKIASDIQEVIGTGIESLDAITSGNVDHRRASVLCLYRFLNHKKDSLIKNAQALSKYEEVPMDYWASVLGRISSCNESFRTDLKYLQASDIVLPVHRMKRSLDEILDVIKGLLKEEEPNACNA